MNKKYLIKTRRMYKALLFDNGKKLAYLGGSTRIANLSGERETIVLSKVKYPSKIAISNDEKILALKTTGRKIEAYNLDDYSLVGKYKALGDDGSNICITPDNKYIMDGTWDGKVYFIDIKKNTYRNIITEQNTMIHSIFNKDGNNHYIVLRNHKKSSKQDKIAISYPSIKETKVSSIEIHRKIKSKPRTKPEYGHLRALLYNEKKDAFLGHSSSGLYHGDSTDNLVRVPYTTKTFRSVCWSESGDYIFIADTENIKVLDYPSFNEIYSTPLKYSCFVKTFYNDLYICIGSWNNGYVYRFDEFFWENP